MSPQSKIIQLTHPVAGNGILAEHCLALCEDGSIWRFMPDNEPERQWRLLFSRPKRIPPPMCKVHLIPDETCPDCQKRITAYNENPIYKEKHPWDTATFEKNR